MRLFKRKPTIKVLVATRHPGAVAALAGLSGIVADVRVVEAATTAGAYNNLPGCSLAVIDVDDLAESPDVSRDGLRAAMQEAGVLVATGEDFADNPDRWLEEALAAAGAITALPPRTVVLASYSGGVGKTTLSTALARYVAGELRLPVAVVEVCYGTSAWRALAAPDLPDIYDVITQGAEPGKWEGITVVPMEYRTAKLLLSREEVPRFLEELRRGHVITIIDAAATNPFFDNMVQGMADMVLVLSDPRPDAYANAVVLSREMADGKARVVANKVRARDRLAMLGMHADAWLPHVSDPARSHRLAEGLLQIIYPGWRKP